VEKPYFADAHGLESPEIVSRSWRWIKPLLDIPSEDGIQLLATRRDLAYSLALMPQLNGGDEARDRRLSHGTS